MFVEWKEKTKAHPFDRDEQKMFLVVEKSDETKSLLPLKNARSQGISSVDILASDPFFRPVDVDLIECPGEEHFSLRDEKIVRLLYVSQMKMGKVFVLKRRRVVR